MAVGQFDHGCQIDLLGEADHPVVGRMDLEHERRLLGDGRLEVGKVGSVGGANLDHHGSGCRHQFGEAVGATDFNQLAARDRHLPPGGEGGERQIETGGVVVDDQGGLSPGQHPGKFAGVTALFRPGCR